MKILSSATFFPPAVSYAFISSFPSLPLVSTPSALTFFFLAILSSFPFLSL